MVLQTQVEGNFFFGVENKGLWYYSETMILCSCILHFPLFYTLFVLFQSNDHKTNVAWK